MRSLSGKTMSSRTWQWTWMKCGQPEKIVAIKEQRRMFTAQAEELDKSILAANPSFAYAASLRSAVEKMRRVSKSFHFPDKLR